MLSKQTRALRSALDARGVTHDDSTDERLTIWAAGPFPEGGGPRPLWMAYSDQLVNFGRMDLYYCDMVREPHTVEEILEHTLGGE